MKKPKDVSLAGSCYSFVAEDDSPKLGGMHWHFLSVRDQFLIAWDMKFGLGRMPEETATLA